MVKYLYYYVNNKTLCKYGSYWVYIENEVEKFKQKNPGKTPTVVFDFICSTTLFIENSKEFLAGGRQAVFSNKAENLFKRLKELGIDLVFFCDGPIKEFKFSRWLKLANEKYQRQQEGVFPAIKNGEEVPLKYAGQMVSAYISNIALVAKKYGKIITSLHNECDVDLAAYATKVHALAVVTLDTDFLIMPGDWAIWSPRYFDLKTLRTKLWNKKNLRLSLDLSQPQMPIFSTLCGNDWMPDEKLKHFWDIFQGGVELQRIAEYIRRHFPKGIFFRGNEFNDLVSLIFNKGQNGYSWKEAKDAVNFSLNFYNYSRHPVPEIQPEWLKKLVEDTGCDVVYSLVHNLTCVIHQSYIDLSKTDVQMYSDLALTVIRRYMGVAHYDQRNDNIKKVICKKSSHEEPYMKYEFTPLFPPISVPPLSALQGYDKNDNAITIEKKFEIFCWVVSPRRGQLKVNAVMELKDCPFLVPVLVLNYLVKEIQIVAFEADVVLLCIAKSKEMTLEELEAIEPPTILDERAFWIAHVFSRLSTIFIDAMKVCGLNDYVTSGFFDGYIFHKMYKKFFESSEQKTLVKTIEKYRLYVS